MSWCPACSPCCVAKKKRRSDKYSYIRYTPSKQSPAPKKQDPGLVPDIEGPVAPAQIFEFPQDQTQVAQHPQMFVTGAVTEQPKSLSGISRFSSLPAGTATIGGFESNYAARKSTTLPRARKEKKSKSPVPPVASSLPDIMSPTLTQSRGATMDMQRRRASEPVTGSCRQEIGWVPGLPVLEENSLSLDSTYPMLQFSIMYDVQRCALTIHLHHAANLPAKDRRGTSDPFVVLYLVPNKEEIFESKVIHQTLDPIFDQSFEFKKLTPDDVFRQTLILRVYDHDKFSKNDSIGGVILPLENAELFGVIMRMKIDEDPNLFSQDSRGDLLLALSYDMALSSLKGVVLKATNLKRQDVIGLADPYIKIRLVHKNKVVDKWKSTVRRNTLVPIFNEDFTFDLLGKDISDISLEVLVMDYDRFSKDDVVGRVMMGRDVEGELERRHWNDMLSGSPQVVSQWHTVKPP